MVLNTTNKNPVQFKNDDLPYRDKFTCLGSIISKDGEPRPRQS